MPEKPTHVIVGASLAGAKAAEALREEGFEGRIVLIGAEPDRPYERPPLSKEFIRGQSPREKAFVHRESFYTINPLVKALVARGIAPPAYAILETTGRGRAKLAGPPSATGSTGTRSGSWPSTGAEPRTCATSGLIPACGSTSAGAGGLARRT